MMTTSPMQVDHSGYLPPFLLGGNSPSRTANTSCEQRGASAGRHFPAGAWNPSVHQSQIYLQKTEKPGGPPVSGLYEETVAITKSSTPIQSTGKTPERRQLTFSGVQSRTGTALTATPTYGNTPITAVYSEVPNMSTHTAIQKTPPSPPQLDPFYTQGECLTSCDRLSDHWVTIFGFPTEASLFILEQFSQYGTILKHVVSNGNYMHICYQSKLQARTALSKNGKVYGNGIMIGVKPCIDKAVMAHEQAPSSPSNPPTQGHRGTPLKSTGMRPLTAAYQASSSLNEVQSSAGCTPQKNTGLVSRAMEYFLGW